MGISSPNINVMRRAAQEAGRSLARDFGEVEKLQVSKKGPSDFVSRADIRSEEIIIDKLKYARPEFGILGEESGETPSRDGRHRWIIDPLDGTSNFLHGIPHWCISIALECDKEIIAGLIYDPIRGEIFMAEKGQGAFMNNSRMRVSGRKNLNDAMVCTGNPSFGASPQEFKIFMTELGAVMPHVAGIRRMGAAALDIAYVASGRYEGFWEHNLKPWDVAAGILILKESGGIITQITNTDSPLYGKSTLAANSAIHGKLAKTLGNAHKELRAAQKVS